LARDANGWHLAGKERQAALAILSKGSVGQLIQPWH